MANEFKVKNGIKFPDDSVQVTAAGLSIQGTDTTSLTSLYPAMVSSVGSSSTVYTSSTKIYFNSSTGDLSATNFNSLSDARYKTNIRTFSNALGTISQLRGVRFQWIDGGDDVGVIAQEVQTTLPELVKENENLDKLTVSYSGLVGLLIQGMNEMQERIAFLEKELIEMRNLSTK